MYVELLLFGPHNPTPAAVEKVLSKYGATVVHPLGHTFWYQIDIELASRFPDQDVSYNDCEIEFDDECLSVVIHLQPDEQKISSEIGGEDKLIDLGKIKIVEKDLVWSESNYQDFYHSGEIVGSRLCSSVVYDFFGKVLSKSLFFTDAGHDFDGHYPDEELVVYESS